MRLRSTASALAAAVTVFVLGAAPAGAQLAADTPVLTLDQAIDLARQQYRPLLADRKEVEKAGERLTAFRAQKKPLFDVRVTTGSLIFPMDFHIPAGAFGVFPSTGPIPPGEATITSNPRASAIVFANVTQPLTQLHRLSQGEQGVALGRDIATEQARARELELIANVRSLYYGIVAAEAGLRARQESIRLFQELVRITERYAADQVVLATDLLTVRAGLQQQEHELLALHNTLAGYRDKLNALLARDVNQPFAVQPQPIAAPDDVSLTAAEEQAIKSRPEVRIRRLQTEQAAFDLRASATPGMPDVSLVFSYVGFWGFQLLPPHGALFGVVGTWQPWDWGRRKAERDEKRLTSEQGALAIAEAESLVRVDVRARFRAVQEGASLLKVCDASREAARERLRVANERAAREALLDREVLDAQARLAQSEAECQQALAGYWTARAEFERARADQ